MTVNSFLQFVIDSLSLYCRSSLWPFLLVLFALALLSVFIHIIRSFIEVY